MTVERYNLLKHGEPFARVTITTRNRMVLNLGLSYLARRTTPWSLALILTHAEEIAIALALTDEERAEALEIADGLEKYFTIEMYA